MRRRLVHASALSVACVCGVAAAPATQAPVTDDALARIGAYVESYYGRAQSILAEESVTIQPLDHDLAGEGFPRRLVYELRVEWNPDDDVPATVHRQLLRATGPLLGPPDQPDCLDPRSVSPEPLAFLLPTRRPEFRFKTVRAGRLNGHAAVMLDYTPVTPQPPKVDWRDQCASIDLPGRTGGRIWADPITSEVLGFDEHLVGLVDIPAPRDPKRVAGPLWFTIERADSSIRYRPVTFTDPDETLLLPAEVTSLTVIRNSGVPRLRMTQRFAKYRRFVTGSRIVP
jgi:hypothetical protein